MTVLLLATLAVALAWPVPLMLGRARWVGRAPAAAMMLWQAVALAGGLAMIATPLMWSLAPFGSNLPQAVQGLRATVDDASWLVLLARDELAPARIAAATLAVVLLIHLLLTLAMTAVRTVHDRRRHRQVLELLTHRAAGDELPVPNQPRSTRVLPHAAPLAYCLPGMLGSITVVSQGLLDRLSQAEIGAVIAHEQAHVRQHHDLLRLAFEAWNRAFSWLPTTQTARDAVSSLSEMLADDAALREHRREDLISALAQTADATMGPTTDSSPAGHPGARKPLPQHAEGPDGAVPVTLRLYRLLKPRPAWARWQSSAVAIVAVLVAAAAPVLLLFGQ